MLNKSQTATEIKLSDDKKIILFEAGRELCVPVEWFARLRSAKLTEL